MIRFRSHLALLALAFGFLAAGCLKRETPVERGLREQVLHRNLGYEVVDLDPHLVTGIAEASVLGALFEGLVAEDPVDLHPVPGVAERWDVAPNGLVYTFHLRAEAKWSDGSPVTAQDFVASYRRVLTPSLGADYANLLYVLQADSSAMWRYRFENGAPTIADLAQRPPAGGPVPAASTISGDAVVLDATVVNDDDDLVRLEVELRPAEEALSGEATHSISAFLQGTAGVDASPLSQHVGYRWRARVSTSISSRN